MTVAQLVLSATLTWEQDSFPTAMCSRPNAREPHVLEPSPDEGWFLCLLQHEDWPEQAALRVLQPYTVRVENGCLFGWADRDGNVFAHKTQSAALSAGDEVVVAWATPLVC